MMTIKRLGAALLLLTTGAACTAEMGDESEMADEKEAIATATQAATTRRPPP